MTNVAVCPSAKAIGPLMKFCRLPQHVLCVPSSPATSTHISAANSKKGIGMGHRTTLASRSKDKGDIRISRSKSVERKKRVEIIRFDSFLFYFSCCFENVLFASHKLHAWNIRRFFRATCQTIIIEIVSYMVMYV